MSSKCKWCKTACDNPIKTPRGTFCSMAHVFEFTNQKKQEAIKRAESKRERDKKKDIALRKEKLKTIPELITEAQASVNYYIRMRDLGNRCISCGSMPQQKRGGTMDAGHYRSRGAAPQLRFNLLNIHAQCVKCNRYGSGNAVDYRISLIEKIGLALVETLECNNKPRSFTREYLARVKKIFRKRGNWYKKRRM
jgi:hypothetical protein